jgi:serine/threonine protein kinase
LSELIKKKKETNIKNELHETFAYFYDIVNAVYYLHENRIIHRDIKPGYITISILINGFI